MVDNKTSSSRVNDPLDVLNQPETRSFFGGDEEILYSGVVRKINKHRVAQKRILVITNKYLYNIRLNDNVFTNLQRWVSPKTALRRKINIKQLAEITLSTHPNSEQFIIHVDGEYDYRYDGVGQRDKIIKTICNAHCESIFDCVYTFYLNDAEDLAGFHTTDDDFQAHIIRKQKHGKIQVPQSAASKGVQFIINYKDDGSADAQCEVSDKSVPKKMGLFEIPEASLEQSAVTVKEESFVRGPIKSIDDIALTTSGVLPQNFMSNKMLGS